MIRSDHTRRPTRSAVHVRLVSQSGSAGQVVRHAVFGCAANWTAILGRRANGGKIQRGRVQLSMLKVSMLNVRGLNVSVLSIVYAHI